MKKLLLLWVSFLFVLLTFNSCKKNGECFDQQLYHLHKNDICTQDCPGVKGCDGKTYCNSCIASSQGIRVEE